MPTQANIPSVAALADEISNELLARMLHLQKQIMNFHVNIKVCLMKNDELTKPLRILFHQGSYKDTFRKVVSSFPLR